MFVATVRPVGPGTQVDVEISGGQRSMHLDAVVIHARKMPPAWQRVHPSGMGLRFLDPDEKVDALREMLGQAAAG